jgi:hypothetical protein
MSCLVVTTAKYEGKSTITIGIISMIPCPVLTLLVAHDFEYRNLGYII